MHYEFTRNGTLVGKFQTYRAARAKWLSFLFRPWTRTDILKVVDTVTGVTVMVKK